MPNDHTAIAEISGADSIAAALRYCETHPGTTTLLPTYVHTGTEYGEFEGIERNVRFLREELRQRRGATLGELEIVGDPTLWRAINGRYASVLAATFGEWHPCVGCHLYLHLMRLPIAWRHDVTTVISGERVYHGTRTKPNQSAAALEAYARVLSHGGVTLAYPVKDVVGSDELAEVLGSRWSGGSPQMECVLSGNYGGLDGACALDSVPHAYLDRYVVPLGERIVTMMRAGEAGYEAAAAGVLRAATGGGRP